MDTGKYFIELDLGRSGNDYADTVDTYDDFENDIYAIGEFDGTIEKLVTLI